ncbi:MULTISPECIES: pyridoxal-phosphate-dependent aminotransferase family protein [Synergistaceae]|uniref:pyridoxal-phosphate-dependent aminotransferase family protein n=1 Tax=Synergistaceae TaxID=649777 RepID=UPI003AE37AA1|nr:alanine--glyoxylate aminotransferase family protein [Synergistaceae bacterium DZ-S4]
MIPTKKLVMIPGPVPVSASVLSKLGSEVKAHTDPDFVAEFQELLAELRSITNCEGIAFLVAGSGTMGMEMAIANIANEKDKVLVCSNGHFGDRYISICKNRGLDISTIEAEWGMSVTPEEVDRKLSEGGYTVAVVTHVETSTGVELPLKEMACMMKEKHPEVLFVVDGVAAGGGVEVDMAWGIDVYFTCSQKALCCVPGMSVVWTGKRALKKREEMGSIRESYVDYARWIPVMTDTKKYWGTPAVNNISALKESVRIMLEEGLDERYRRHREHACLIAEAMSALGFRTLAKEGYRSPTLSIFLYPEKMPVDDAGFRAACAAEGALVAACLGDYAGKGFRMGHMGNLDKHMLISGVAAIERAAISCGLEAEPGAALAVMQRGLAGK